MLKDYELEQLKYLQECLNTYINDFVKGDYEQDNVNDIKITCGDISGEMDYLASKIRQLEIMKNK